LLVSLHIPGVAVYHIKHLNTVHKGNGIIICIYRMPWIYHTGVVTIYSGTMYVSIYMYMYMYM
jgi:hypothetical protein